jgi:uncharacterized SAM-binding protein YcdF (DUF218 family)
MSLPFGFVLKKFIAALVLPPVLPMLCTAAGLLLLRKFPRLGRGLAGGGLLLMWLLSTPVVISFLAAPLEAVPVLQAQNLGRAQAIVILGAGQRIDMPEYGGPTPNRLALERLRYGARLARLSGLPILVSGGAPTGERPEAELMAASLSEDFGVEPRWLEDTSLDTADNATFSTRMLRNAGIERVVLVTHAAHMRRAVGEFAAQGLEVIPAPTAFLSSTSAGEEFRDYLPGPSAAYESWLVTHEWLGLLAQKLRLALS